MLDAAGYVFMGLALIAAAGVLFVRNVFHAALMLLITVLSLAGVYVLLYAEFVAVTQILIYAGGILTIMLFGIMLTARVNGQPLLVQNNKWVAGILTSLPAATILITLFAQHSFPVTGAAAVQSDNMRRIGVLTMTDYLLPFELAGLLLLMALVGAVVTATMKDKPEA